MTTGCVPGEPHHSDRRSSAPNSRPASFGGIPLASVGEPGGISRSGIRHRSASTSRPASGQGRAGRLHSRSSRRYRAASRKPVSMRQMFPAVLVQAGRSGHSAGPQHRSDLLEILPVEETHALLRKIRVLRINQVPAAVVAPLSHAPLDILAQCAVLLVHHFEPPA